LPTTPKAVQFDRDLGEPLGRVATVYVLGRGQFISEDY